MYAHRHTNQLLFVLQNVQLKCKFTMYYATVLHKRTVGIFAEQLLCSSEYVNEHHPDLIQWFRQLIWEMQHAPWLSLFI